MVSDIRVFIRVQVNEHDIIQTANTSMRTDPVLVDIMIGVGVLM